jgi:hypothetical protein
MSEGDSAEDKNTPRPGTISVMRGQLTPMPASMKSRPELLDFSQPHLLLLNNSENVTAGDFFEYDSRYFLVKLPPENWNAETSTSCKACMLEELQYKPEGFDS